ncbi:MAG: ribonuclease P protein component [Candidatus Cloacimonetes bacterium]|nr:ribonuclease P protein component [Candidatus Cloacimonadota bacterium]
MRFIKKSQEYSEVFSNSYRLSGLYFNLRVKKQSDGFAVGIITGKKTGNAVKRNLVKRRVKAYLRNHTEYSGKNVKIVIISNDSTASASWNEICMDLDGLMKRIK